MADRLGGGQADPVPVVTGSDDWNVEQRDEMPLRRADRNFAELLQELRVVLTGVQILFGFLLTASFSERFTRLDTLQVTVFLVTLLCAATSSALLVAPVAAHRIVFQRGRKPELVRWAHLSALTGMGFLGLTMSSGLLLVFDLAVGRVPAFVVAGVFLAAVVAVWAVVPLSALR
ncbi:hypothetical protein EV383_3639 [Pseudonocardia sediminis]|uniref:Sodium:proton antiporter n=1 Tax=Pseudonocardia sediminis TaxID=1397368 RepID=A0A4Q7V0B6_PSEST|nr:hypothetical protein EV383_3639 [Pseudonocardia sediminis]